MMDEETQQGQQQAPAGGTQQGQQGQQQQGEQQAPPTWETWLAGQPENVRALYETHTTGLRNALQSERDQRAELARQLKDLAKKQQEGSEARASLDEMSRNLEAANARADFFEDAARPEVGCRNPKLAWMAAQSGEYVRRGKVDWTALKADYPELFGAPPQPRGNAGSGTGAPQAPPATMDTMIRRAAGRS